jgi:hypothetical protein
MRYIRNVASKALTLNYRMMSSQYGGKGHSHKFFIAHLRHYQPLGQLDFRGTKENSPPASGPLL